MNPNPPSSAPGDSMPDHDALEVQVTALLLGELSAAEAAQVRARIESDPAAVLTLDLTEKKLSIADTDFPVTIADHAHEALVSGKWDAIADLLEGLDAVKSRASALPYMAA